MKKIDLGQTIQIVASLGVIGGILLLAYELRQNNELLLAEAGQRALENRAGTLRGWADDSGDLMQLRLKAVRDDQLTTEEEWRVFSDAGSLFVLWEWEYQQFESGRLSYIPVAGYRVTLNRWPYLVDLWNAQLRLVFSEDFARFIDEEVLGPDDEGG